MLTKHKYVEYLWSTPTPSPCPNLADPGEGVSHEAVSDFWQRDRLTPRHLGERGRGRLEDHSEACLRAEDRVQAKRYSQGIERVKHPSRGHEPGRVQGRGGVNLGLGHRGRRRAHG
jgi:hypothetical protein